jgi:hypothetical protein
VRSDANKLTVHAVARWLEEIYHVPSINKRISEAKQNDLAYEV